MQPMNVLKQMGLMIFELVKQMTSLPRLIPDAVRQRRLQAIADQVEVERLDRIRNPSKYLGK